MAENNRRALRGVFPAAITPRDRRGAIDFAYLEKQLAYLCDAGVDGLFLCGTTAEGLYLRTQERRDIIQLSADISNGRQTICVAGLAPSTADIIRELTALDDLAIDYMSAITPLYYPAHQEALAAHFRAIAEAVPAPLILYNIPQNTHNTLHLDTILELSRHERIVGIKDSSGNFAAYSQGVLTDPSDDFAWIQGEDLLEAPSYLLGAQGVVTGLGNVWIEPYVRMYRAATAGDTTALLAEQRRVFALARIIDAAEGAVIPAIKAACALLGRSESRMHVEPTTLDADHEKRVGEILTELELI